MIIGGDRKLVQLSPDSIGVLVQEYRMVKLENSYELVASRAPRKVHWTSRASLFVLFVEILDSILLDV